MSDKSEHRECWKCGGEGYKDWDDLQFEDPLWYSPDDIIECDECGGEGVIYIKHGGKEMIRTKDMLQEEYDKEKEADRVLRFKIQESLTKERYYYEESKSSKERTVSGKRNPDA